jgi:hypothetical protein
MVLSTYATLYAVEQTQQTKTMDESIISNKIVPGIIKDNNDDDNSKVRFQTPDSKIGNFKTIYRV